MISAYRGLSGKRLFRARFVDFGNSIEGAACPNNTVAGKADFYADYACKTF